MKITNFAIALVASVCVCSSCSSDEDAPVVNDVKVKKVIGVGTQTSSKSRTIVDDWARDLNRSQTVLWQETDKITVFAKGHTVGDEFKWSAFTGAYNSHANFEGYTYESTKYYILYPAQSSARLIGDDKVKLNIPHIQKAVKNSFDPNANIQLAAPASLSTGTDLANVCSYFYIKVPANANKVTVKATNESWYLAGNVIVDNITSAGNHIASFETGCYNEIELNGITEEGTYLISFIPTTGMNSGLEVCVYTTAGPIQVDYDQAAGGFSFTAGSYYDLGDYTLLSAN